MPAILNLGDSQSGKKNIMFAIKYMYLDHLILLENSLVDDILIKAIKTKICSLHLKNKVSQHPKMAGIHF
jgi:hypothetical protein